LAGQTGRNPPGAWRPTEDVSVSLWADLLLYTSLIATPIALLRRSWAAMAMAAVLSLLLSAAALFSIGFLLALIPCLQVAAALALRWRIGVGGRWLLVLCALAVWAVGGPGYLASDAVLPVFLVLPAGLLVGFALLAWDRPPSLRGAA
jgi:hypothetical protein